MVRMRSKIEVFKKISMNHCQYSINFTYINEIDLCEIISHDIDSSDELSDGQ